MPFPFRAQLASGAMFLSPAQLCPLVEALVGVGQAQAAILSTRLLSVRRATVAMAGPEAAQKLSGCLDGLILPRQSIPAAAAAR